MLKYLLGTEHGIQADLGKQGGEAGRSGVA